MGAYLHLLLSTVSSERSGKCNCKLHSGVDGQHGEELYSGLFSKSFSSMFGSFFSPPTKPSCSPHGCVSLCHGWPLQRSNLVSDNAPSAN